MKSLSVLLAFFLFFVACTKSGSQPPVQPPPADTTVTTPPKDTTATPLTDTTTTPPTDTTGTTPPAEVIKVVGVINNTLIVKSDGSWTDLKLQTVTNSAEFASDADNAVLLPQLVTHKPVTYSIDPTTQTYSDHDYIANIPESDLCPKNPEDVVASDTTNYPYVEIDNFDAAKKSFVTEKFVLVAKGGSTRIRVLNDPYNTLDDAKAKAYYSGKSTGEMKNTF